MSAPVSEILPIGAQPSKGAGSPNNPAAAAAPPISAVVAPPPGADSPTQTSLNLATATQAAAAPTQGTHKDNENAIVFQGDSVFKNNPVILIDDGPVKTVSWSVVDPSATPHAIVWYTRDWNIKVGEITRVNFDSKDAPEQPFISATNTSAVLNMTAFDVGQHFNLMRGQPMRLAVISFHDQQGSMTGSDTFAIAKADRRTELGEDEAKAALGRIRNAGEYALPNDAAAIGSAPIPRPVYNGTANAGSKGSPDDLSTGAIAGIAVGAAVGGLLITGLILWLFFRKRKQTRDRESMFLEEQKARVLADKEEQRSTTAGSPISPYTEDKLASRRPESMLPPIPSATPIPPPILKSPTSPIAPPAAPALAHKTSQASVAASFSSARQEQPRPASSSSAAARSSPAREVPASVAHLVEDGMTDADIQRLEEEERQLDLEIERKTRGARRS